MCKFCDGWLNGEGLYQEAALKELSLEAISIEYELTPSIIAKQIQMKIINEI